MKRPGWTAVALASLALIAVAVAPATRAKDKAKEKAGNAPATQTMPAGHASAAIEGRSGSTLSGTAEFMSHGGMTMITVEVKGAPPGVHAVHIHEKGDCSAPDGSSAGGHFNPGSHQHGSPDAPEHHAGDLGNMTVGEDGTGSLMIHSGDLTIAPGPNSVVGRAIIIHEKSDDFVTQPTGNAGGRIGCGVIQAGS
jgi:Cu-Zn family superoxide dismutase